MVSEDDNENTLLIGSNANHDQGSHGKSQYGQDKNDAENTISTSCPHNIQNIQECATSITALRNNNIHDRSRDNIGKHCKTKVRILLSVISALYFSRGIIKSVIFQYLLHRWSLEAGHNSTVSLGSVCERNESNPAFKEANAIQSRVADASVYYSWCFSFPCFFTCILMGALVDLVGRKTGLLISQLGSALQLMTILAIIRFNLHTDLFYLAYALEGAGGGIFGFLIASLSCTADVSGDKKSRIVWVIVILTSTHLFTSGFDVGIGYVIRTVGYFWAVVVILVPASVGIFLTAFVLPETLPTRGETTFSMKKMWNQNTQVLFLYVRDGNKAHRWSLFLSLMIFFMNTMSKISVTSTDTLYQKHEPLCWGSVDIGYYIAFRSATHAVAGLGYVMLSRCFGCARDEVNSMISLLFLAGSFVVEAFVKNTWEMYMVPVISLPSVNVSSITRGVMSYLVGPGKQGALFSSMALLETLCDLVSSSIYNNVYSYTVDYMPGAVYFLMAGNAFITFLLYIPFFHFYERPPKTYGNL